MDLQDFIYNDGTKTIPNPKYNSKSKKNKQPKTIKVLDLNPDNDRATNMAVKDYNNQWSVDAEEVEKYRDYGINYNPAEAARGTLDTQLAESQSNLSKAWNAVTQTLVSEVGLGTLRGISDLVDFVIGGAIRTVTGEENDYTNPVSEKIKELQEDFERNNPIYVEPGVDISNGGLLNFGWWMKNLPSVASSLTLLIPSTGFTKGLAALGKATRATKAVGNARRFLTNINKVDKAADAGEEIGALGRFAQWVNNENTIRKTNQLAEFGINGFTSRIMENYQESNQVYQDMLPEIYNGDASKGVKGINDMDDNEYAAFINRNSTVLEGVDTTNRAEVAKRIAKEAADTTFRLDMLNGFFDVYELYGLRNIKRFMNGPMRASVRRQHLNSIKYAKELQEGKKLEDILKARSKWAKAKDKLGNALYGSRVALIAQLNEGVEEAVNYIAQEEGMHYGRVLLGTTDPNNFWDTRLKDYMASPQLYESAFWGLMGGVIFQAGGSKLAKASNAYNTKRREAKSNAKIDESSKQEVKKTPWSEAFELPEVSARINNINARQQANIDLKSQLEQIKKGINPFEKNEDGTNKLLESEEEKAVARDKAYNTRATKLLLDAMFVGNWDITRAYLESDEVRDALVSTGVVSQEEATRRQQEAKQLADKMEESYSRHLRAVGNAMRGLDKATGTKYEDVPTEYFQIVAAENMQHELNAETYENNIKRYNPVIKSEEARIAEELEKSGIDYKQTIKAFILAQQLGQIEAELEAARKTKKEGRTDANYDPTTVSGQNAIRELELRKKILTRMINELAPALDTNVVGDKKQQEAARKIRNIANAIVTRRAVAATESDGEGGYKMNPDSKKYKDVDDAIVKAFNATDEEDWNVHVTALSNIGIESGTKDEFKQAARLADVINENMKTALGQNGAIESLDNISHKLLMAYATITHNEIAREIEKGHVYKDREGIRYAAHIKHNDMSTLRGVVLEQAVASLKAIAKTYSEEHGDISELLAYGTLQTDARNRLKAILSPEHFRLYDDIMKIIALNNRKVTGNKRTKETLAINSLLPEIVKDAIYEASRDEFVDVDETILDEPIETPKEEEKGDDSQSSSTSQNGSQPKQKTSSNNTSRTQQKTNTGEEKQGKIDFTHTKNGHKTEPLANIYVNDEGRPIRFKQYSKDDDTAYVKPYLIPVEGQPNTYEIDIKRELEDGSVDEAHEIFTNPYFFNTTTSFIDGGRVLSNPVVVLDDDGTLDGDIRPGVIGKPENNPEETQAGEGTAPITSTGEEVPIGTNPKEDEEINPSVFDEEGEENASNADTSPVEGNGSGEEAAQPVQTTEPVEDEEGMSDEELHKAIQADLTKEVRRAIADGIAFDEEGIYKKLLEKYIDVVSEDIFRHKFRILSAASKLILKRRNAEVINLIDFIDESNIADEDIDDGIHQQAEKNTEILFNAILNNYAKRAEVGTYNGKKVISLENLLRYANQLAGDNTIAQLLYDKFLYLLSDNSKYILTEGKALNKNVIIDNASLTSEERLNEAVVANGKTLNLDSVFGNENITNEDKEKIYDILDELKPDEELDVEIVGNRIEFRKDGLPVSSIQIPTVNGTSYIMNNKGWRVDIPRTNDGTKSKLEQLFIRIMLNPNNEKEIEPIIEAIQKAMFTPSKIKNKETEKEEANPEYIENYTAIINAIKNAGINVDDYLYEGEEEPDDVELAKYVVNVYKGVKTASEQWLGRYGITRAEYEDAIKNARLKSIHNWFERLRDSYDAAKTLASNPNFKVKIDANNQGGLVITSPSEAKPVNEEGVIGSKHKGKLELVVASITEPGKLYSTGNIITPIMGISGGATFLAIPRTYGPPALVHAFPQAIGSEHLDGVVKTIQEEILKEFDRLLSEWSDDANKSSEEIYDFINLLCSRKGNNNPFLSGFRAYHLTGGYSGMQIEYYENGVRKFIKLFDRHPDGTNGSVIKFHGEKARAFKKKGREEVLTKFREIVNNTLKYNLEFDYVKGTLNLNGVARRDGQGRFIVQIPNGEEHVFDSYKKFVIDNGLIAVTTKSENGKTNFYRHGTSRNQYDKQRITYKIVNPANAPVAKTGKTTPAQSNNKKGDIVKDLIQKNPNSDAIGKDIIKTVLNGTQLSVLSTSKLLDELLLTKLVFIKDFKGAIAAHIGKTLVHGNITLQQGTIVVTQKWIDYLNSDDVNKQEEAIRHLIHESIHKKIDTLSESQQRKLFDTIRTIYDAFVAANEREGLSSSYNSFYYNKTDKDYDRYYKNGRINDRGLEEFLIESITRPVLIQRLNSIAINGKTLEDNTVGNIKSDNLFRKILSVICKLFNLNINKGSLLEKEYRLFTQVGILTSEGINKKNKQATSKTDKQRTTRKTKKQEDPNQLTFNFDENVNDEQQSSEQTGEEIIQQPVEEGTQEKDEEVDTSEQQTGPIIKRNAPPVVKPVNQEEEEDDVEDDRFDDYSAISDESVSYTEEMQTIKEKAIVDGTFMKAPNGKLTNLNERQWLQVRTKNFINWFGDWINDPANASKVVDENGEPLVVYHGTNIENINIFDRNQIPEEQTLVGTGTATFGNFFSNSQIDAKSFADITRLKRRSGKATVYTVFLNIKNPMYFETLGDFRDYSHKEGHYNENGDFVSDVKLPKEYDGVIVKQRNSKDNTKEFVAPTANQIKSATDNIGTFSTENDDINFSSISDDSINKHNVDSLAQVRDAIIPENRNDFERLINKGAIQINC